eukprot:TRINITY_DN18279_c0_g1_i1.p1 TRINITY_DN18279_c0_g1~~TRINITY_DN18279_c0_g1_i1.p1  ORF type:complete len:400 (+),score=129.61 TRINITY_DN18279_c0_g1_i1:224-1423(+)
MNVNFKVMGKPPYDESSGSDGETTDLQGFEGPEKRLQVDFFANPLRPYGLREFKAEQWQELLNLAKCTIISQTSNAFFDSYVLSESSLFVYPNKIMLKTCGTTTLLHCVDKLLEFAAAVDLIVKLIVFSRKNYVFPKEQQHPHDDWSNEVLHLNRLFDGEAHVIGPVTGAHWYVYVADYSDCAPVSDDELLSVDDAAELEHLVRPQPTLEIMMHGLSLAVCRRFYRTADTQDKDKFPGVAELLPGSTTDEFNFSPCGYSMNGLLGPAYYTIHVTPEPHCSYASFETNAELSAAARAELVLKVLTLFEPSTAFVTLQLPAGLRSAEFVVPCKRLAAASYRVKHQSRTNLDADVDIVALTIVDSQQTGAERRAGPSAKIDRLAPASKPSCLSSNLLHLISV